MDDNWIRVGSLDRASLRGTQAEERAVRRLLEHHGHGGVPDRDVRRDVLCHRDDALTSILVVYVAATPSPPRVRRTPRHADGSA